MTQLAVPLGTWAVKDPRATGRGVINCFAEVSPTGGSQLGSPQDTKEQAPIPPAYLRRAPGITQLATTNTSPAVRGMWQMNGVQYAVIGGSFVSISSTGTVVALGTGVIPGTGLVRMTDNGNCLVILVPGSTTCYTYCPTNGGYQQLTAAGFTQYGALDCWFVDSYIVFLALNGKEFFNDDGAGVSGTGQITFNSAAVFPRELATDLVVGMCVDHREVLLFGTNVTDGYQNAGNPTGSPFSTAPSSYMPIGMHPLGGFSVAIQDQSVFWLANDLTIRRRSGQTPTKVSNYGVEGVLATANLAGCYALAYSVGGHLMYALTMPAQQTTLVYDCSTGEWHQMSSLINGSWSYWRPTCVLQAQGRQLVGDSQAGNIGYLDMTAFTEFGTVQAVTFFTQSVYDAHNRIAHRRLELIITPGQGTSFTQGAKITCYRSKNSGATYRALQDRTLGAVGKYANRVYWLNIGEARDMSYKFVISDPTPLFAVDIQAELQGGRF